MVKQIVHVHVMSVFYNIIIVLVYKVDMYTIFASKGLLSALKRQI
jgi:hypothetical protein